MKITHNILRTSSAKLAFWVALQSVLGIANAAITVDITPDSAGNMLMGATQSKVLTVRSGDTLRFKNLGPLDNIIELNSATLSSSQVCSALALPTATAHTVPVQSPLPAGYYEKNELSGPYRTYPAGIFSLSVGTDECGYIEKTTPCAAPNEFPIDVQINAAGQSEYLCRPSIFLLSPTDPTKPSTVPPTVNPVCALNRTLETTWADSAIQGVFLRLSWSDINPAYGVYDWTNLDRELVAAVRNGKNVTLGIRVGGNSIPSWVFTTPAPNLAVAKKVQLRDWGTSGEEGPNDTCGFSYAVASPSDINFKTLFKKTLDDLGAHIRSDQRFFSVLAGVKVTGMGEATLENRLPSRCNIALRNTALGDTGTQGHIVSMSSPSIGAPVFDPKYSITADATQWRVRDVSQCVCNPQVLAAAGYRPSILRTFYSEIEATLQANFGYKQLIFMNISQGFPQIGESGRYLGDHLAPPILSSTVNASGQTVFTYGTVAAAIATVPNDIVDDSFTTQALVEDARNGVFAGGDLTKARGVGVENAALDTIGFSGFPNQGVKCRQQLGIDITAGNVGNPQFPIAKTTLIDATGVRCPNAIAVREGVANSKITGFQVRNVINTASDIDAALWNMTLNTNGVFFEPYEFGAWRMRKESARNAGGVLNATPAVKVETATLNFSAATAKSGAMWNAVLLARAKTLSADPANNNLFQANPYPSEYSVAISATSTSERYFFNSRACKAFRASATPVSINTVSIVPDGVVGTPATLLRMYNTPLRTHLYTIDANEYAVLATIGWSQDGVVGKLLNAGSTVFTRVTKPLYRLYNPILRKHLFTTDANENAVLATRGWSPEGVIGYMSDQGDVATPGITQALYRLYNAGLQQHLYTTDSNEVSVLSGLGSWVNEGVVGHLLR